jgi:hypothetical protein
MKEYVGLGKASNRNDHADADGTPSWLGLVEYSRTDRFFSGKYCRIN